MIPAIVMMASAQTPPAQQAKSVIGEVTAVDAGARTLNIKTDSGVSYTVKLQENSAFLRMMPGETDIKKASSIKLNDIAVGDRVLARGPVSEEDKTVPARTVVVMTKKDLAAKHDEERAAWQKGVVGIVTAVNPDTKQITVTQRGAGAKTLVVDASGKTGFLRYAPGSYQFDQAKPGTFADIKPGDNLRARGEKEQDGSLLKADEILTGAFQTIAATVISVDAANGTVKVTDLQTKKPVEVKLTPETLVRRIPERMATMMAFRMNPEAAAAARAAGQGGPGGPGGPGGAPAGMRPGGAPGGPGGADRPGGAGGPGGPGGGPGGPGGPGGRGGNFDLQQALERMPAMPLTELKPGDAVIISSTKGSTPANLTAITLVAGVEPFLASAPRTAGQVNLGSWSFDGGIPAQ